MPSRLDPDIVRNLIKERGFPSVAAFGRHIGLSQSSLDRLFKKTEAHNFTQQTIDLIADGLGVNPFDLYKKEALDGGVAAAAAENMAEAVTEAVVAAVTVVASDVAPDATPQEVASAVPSEIPVTPPIDLVMYFNYLRDTHEAEIKTLTTMYNERIAELAKSSRQLTRALCGVIAALIFAVIYLLIK